MLSFVFQYQLPPEIVNKEMIRDFYIEVYQKGNMEIVDEVISPSFISNDWPESLIGPRGFKIYYKRLKKLIPNANIEVKDLIAEDNLVMVRWEMTGTKIDGEKVNRIGITIYKIESDMLIKRSIFLDSKEFLMREIIR